MSTSTGEVTAKDAIADIVRTLHQELSSTDVKTFFMRLALVIGDATPEKIAALLIFFRALSPAQLDLLGEDVPVLFAEMCRKRAAQIEDTIPWFWQRKALGERRNAISIFDDAFKPFVSADQHWQQTIIRSLNLAAAQTA